MRISGITVGSQADQANMIAAVEACQDSQPVVDKTFGLSIWGGVSISGVAGALRQIRYAAARFAIAPSESQNKPSRHLMTSSAPHQQASLQRGGTGRRVASLTAVRGNPEPTAVDLSTIGLKDRFYLMAEYRYRKIPAGNTGFTYRYRQRVIWRPRLQFNFDGVEVEVGSELDTLLTIDTYIFDAIHPETH